MARIYVDFVSGTLAGSIGPTATTIESAGLASLPVIDGGDIVVLVLDPFGEDGTPEVVFVTAHTASATSATVLRGRDQEKNGSPGRNHAANTLWIHAPVASDWDLSFGQFSGIKNSPGTELATAAPTTLVAGGNAQTGTGTSISRSDHRHALPAGVAGSSAPGDAAAGGTSNEVARADHRHAREQYGSVGAITGVGATAAAGTSSDVARADHRHPLGVAVEGIGVRRVRALTLAQYNALSPPDQETYYIILES